MGGNGTLIVNLERKIQQWESLAREARLRADQCQPGDMDPTYLYGCADQLEQNAQALRAVIDQVLKAIGDQDTDYSPNDSSV